MKSVGFEVRLARPEDLADLKRLRLAMSYSDSLFFDERTWFELALRRLDECLPRLKELLDWRVLVFLREGLVSGYLLFVADEEHGVTHQLQARILDFAVFDCEALLALIQRARKIVTAFRNEYLVVDVADCDKRTQLWFYRCGFRAEQQRVVRWIPKGYRGMSSPHYRIRKATAEDLPFVLEVHSAFSEAYRPAGRDVDLQALEFRYQLTYLTLDFENSLYFVLEDVSSGQSVGYLFLQEGPLFGTKRSFYVYDVAIAPAYSGRGLSLYLKGAAETWAGQEGALLYGDGTLGVPSLASWHSQMGYKVDTIHFALDCRKETC